MKNPTAEISAWYKDLNTGTLFEVVALDYENDTIEIQHIDGEVGEYDSTTWKQLNLTPAEAPEDWRSPFEINREDNNYNDQAMVPENWSDPLSEIEPEMMDFGDDFQIL
jgi:hypothetical protein